ncbi:Mad3/BUB1 homology region 1-domain-containing protein [Butyriboletus roseoflavus]|nr:Mad3/BUB1 homology region 1-domain-containing protein [Butyriboletus roseoflavus]
MPALRPSQLEHQRAEYRASIKEALEEDEDPLAAYDDFIKWTSRTFPENDPGSGLIQLLEEVTRKFKDDARYSGDLRYLKLWCSYAKMVEKPGLVYAYLVKREIGCVYGLLWEEYALALEKEGRRTDADKVFRTGIARSARPIERLKKRYRDFQSRPSSKHQSASFRSSGNSEVDALRRSPFKNHDPAPSTSSSTSKSSSAVPSSSTNNPSTAHGRYAPMLAPPAPGRRPEKLRFNLSLLFTPSGVEYSTQEVRARSMGLLGKKWGPPPASELRDSSSGAVMVNFNDDGSKSTQNMGATASGGKRKSVNINEPTVTINTKEALADVFGMYNSPDKTVKRTMPELSPESKSEGPRTLPQSENAKPPAFKPFVDENVPRKENPAPPLKFKPFVDEPKQASVAPTHEAGRRALSLKDSSVVSGKDVSANPSTTKPSPLNGSKSSVLKPISEEPQGLPVFSKPFTPVSQKEPLVRPSQTKINSDAKTGNQGQAQPPSQPFVPFVDSKTPFKVFSRPPGQGENAVLGSGGGSVFTPKPPSATGLGGGTSTGTFKPFIDNAQPVETPASTKKSNVLQQRVMPIPPIIEEASTDESSEADLREAAGDPDAEDGHVISSGSRSGFSESEDGYADEGGEAEAEMEAAVVSSSDSQFDDDDDYHQSAQGEQVYGDEDAFREEDFADEDEENYRPPLGGRFGRINVMTPITERTLEFSTRGFPTPTSTTQAGEGLSDEREWRERGGQESGRYALEVAEKLAQEVREQEEDNDHHNIRDGVRTGDNEAIEECTGRFSLADSMAVVSAFRPPNPCVPSDPQIVSTLLSLLPADGDFHDLRAQDGGMLDGLQRFAARVARKSGKSRKSGSTDDDEMLVDLEGRSLRVSGKLGEGGFGAVFSARELTKSGGEDDEEDVDVDEDEDDDDNSMVALKVVKPRNLWEFHILRRIHRTLPASLTRSIITPHALYAFRDESHLLLELCPHGSLLDAVNRAGLAGISQQGACLDELLVFFFTIELLRFLEGLHAVGFIHGDLKIDNCLLRFEELPGSLSGIYQPSGEGGWEYRGIKVIDFGRTIDASLFPARHGQEFIADWPADDRDCFEIREGRPWTYQTDYFGLAGIVYCMLFGKYIEASSVMHAPDSTDLEPIYKIATPLKRYWQTDILTRLFDMLLNPCRVREDGSLPICEELGGVRVEMERWLQSNCNRSSNTLKGLLKKVELSAYTHC